MKDATLDLYKAVRAVLAADAAVAADVPAARILSDWSRTPNTPFIRLHIPQVLPWEADCGEGGEHTVHVHVYTAEESPIVVSRIAANVRQALDGARPTLDDAELWWIEYAGTIARKDPESPNVQTARVEFTAVATDKT
jgi:hypothetical protein